MSPLKITETFVSIQGEADAVGWPFSSMTSTALQLASVWRTSQMLLICRTSSSYITS